MRDLVMLIGRILMAALFLQSGYAAATNIPGTIQYFQSVGLPMASFTVWGVIALELVGGLALFLGFFARPFAALLGLFSLGAAVIGHSNIGDTNQFQMLMKDIAIAGGLFYIAIHGAGGISIDGRRQASPAIYRDSIGGHVRGSSPS